MSKNFRLLFSLDWITFALICTIAGIGLLFVFSATHTASAAYSLFFKKQLLGVFLGIILYWCFIFLDYRSAVRTGYFAYFIVIGLLLFTLVKGIGMSAPRWLNLFFFKLQPSELVKPLFPAFVSYYFFTHHETHSNAIKNFILPLVMLGLSFILIVKQPHLGTAIIVSLSGLLLFWLAGLPRTFFLCGILMSFIAAPILWHVLKEYQRNRIAVFFGYGTTQKERYQIEQAAIAIGSGGFTGKGLLKGTQNQLQFLPESRNDFIFAVVCEEWGFLGAFTVLLLYTFLFLRIIYIIHLIEAPYLQLLAVGLLIHLVLSTIINIFMVLGLLPIVGIPLPFMSSGLSNLLISFASLGWIQGIYIQQK